MKTPSVHKRLLPTSGYAQSVQRITGILEKVVGAVLRTLDTGFKRGNVCLVIAKQATGG